MRMKDFQFLTYSSSQAESKSLQEQVGILKPKDPSKQFSTSKATLFLSERNLFDELSAGRILFTLSKNPSYHDSSSRVSLDQGPVFFYMDRY